MEVSLRSPLLHHYCGTGGTGHHREAETTKAVHTFPSTALVSGFKETKPLPGFLFLRFDLNDFDALV